MPTPTPEAATAPRSRAEKKLVTRSRLLDAAEKVFSTRGFADASLDEIAEIAGLTKGAVYSNFDKKLDLLLAVLDERMNRRFISITELVDTSQGLPEQAEEGGRLFMEAFQEERDLYLLWLECSVHSVHDPDVREALVQLDQAIRRAVANFITYHADLLGITLPIPAMQLATAAHLPRRRPRPGTHEESGVGPRRPVREPPDPALPWARPGTTRRSERRASSGPRIDEGIPACHDRRILTRQDPFNGQLELLPGEGPRDRLDDDTPRRARGAERAPT